VRQDSTDDVSKRCTRETRTLEPAHNGVDHMTIVEAIRTVLESAADPLTVDEVHTRIIERSLYNFRAIDPKHVVRSQLRRHCIGLEFPSASPVK
jgi:undecaprenyl pyrophosphate synthase